MKKLLLSVYYSCNSVHTDDKIRYADCIVLILYQNGLPSSWFSFSIIRKRTLRNNSSIARYLIFYFYAFCTHCSVIFDVALDLRNEKKLFNFATSFIFILFIHMLNLTACAVTISHFRDIKRFITFITDVWTVLLRMNDKGREEILKICIVRTSINFLIIYLLAAFQFVAPAGFPGPRWNYRSLHRLSRW